MNPQLREKLIVSEYYDLVQLSWKVARVEQFIIEREQRRSSKAGPRGSQLVAVVDHDSADEEGNHEEGVV